MDYRTCCSTDRSISVSLKVVNLFFPPDVNKGDLHNVHMLAWAKNLKTLYYLRSEAISRADNVSNQAKREIIFEQSDCLSCEG